MNRKILATANTEGIRRRLMKKKRVIGYDIIKFIAMFLVVMLHYSFYTRYYSRGLAGTLITVLCVVCVPLFSP